MVVRDDNIAMNRRKKKKQVINLFNIFAAVVTAGAWIQLIGRGRMHFSRRSHSYFCSIFHEKYPIITVKCDYIMQWSYSMQPYGQPTNQLILLVLFLLVNLSQTVEPFVAVIIVSHWRFSWCSSLQKNSKWKMLRCAELKYSSRIT